jgi:SRSO17 transposase
MSLTLSSVLETASATITQDDVQEWAKQFDQLVDRIAPYFKRIDTQQHAQDYLQGLLSSIERKNGWQIAEQVGDVNPYGIQHLLGRSAWDADALRNELRRYVVEHLGHCEAVAVIDETGFLKKGNQSVGVQRQYSGTAGRIENCQIGVFLSYATPNGYTFLDRELYLPKSWTDDPDRCRQVGVPDTTQFATKPQLARQMLQRLFEAQVPCRWVSASEVYGSDRRLRLWLEEQHQAYVLAVSVKEPLWIGYQQYRASEVAATIPATDWVKLSCGDGTKGPREYDWATVPFNCPTAPDWQRWLLVRRSLSEPTDLAYYVVFAPQTTRIQEMVSVAGTRWTIETSFETAKGEVGLDHYQVRSWQGWYRHITLALFNHSDESKFWNPFRA